MKKYLLTGALITITATTLYATTAGSTVVDAMKAATHSFTLATSLNPGQTNLQSAPLSGKKAGDMLTAEEYNRMLEVISQGGAGGSGWENVPLTDTVDFDTSCLYRFQTGGNAYPTFMGNSPYYIVNAVSPTQLTWWLDMGGSDIRHISSTSKTKYRINGVEYAASGGITKIEKLCGGGGAGGSGLALYKCTNTQSLDATNAPCYGAARNGGAGTAQYRVVSCTDFDGTRSYTMSSILNFGQLVVNKWAVSVNGGTIECDDGTVLVMDTQGGGSGGGSNSSWVDVPLTDTADYDTSCEYRFQLNKPLVDGNWSFGSPTPAGNHYYYATYVANNIITASGTYNVMHGIPKGTKNKLFLYWVNGTGVDYSPSIYTTKIEKRCN